MSKDIQTVQMTHGEAMEALWRRGQVIKRLQKENKKLRAALKPFADKYAYIMPKHDLVDACRATAAALKETVDG